MTSRTNGNVGILAAQIELAHSRVRASVVAKVLELSEGGLNDHEIASHLTMPVHLVRLVLRGGARF